MEAKLKKIIQVAIKAEEDAIRIYSVGLKRSNAAASKALFRMLVKQEKAHKLGLQSLLKGNILIGAPPKGGDLRLAESISQTPLSELGELIQIIKFAIGKERGAQRRYRRMAKLFKGKAKTLIQNFEKQEKHHEELLKKEMEKLK